MSRFLDNAREILETAEHAMQAGQSPSQLAILVGVEGGIRIVAESDWPLEALQREHGAKMAYRVQTATDRVSVDGREGLRTCHFETAAPAQVARLLLNSAPVSYSLALLSSRS